MNRIHISKTVLMEQIEEEVGNLECEGDDLVFDHIEDVWYWLYSGALGSAVSVVPKKVVVT